MREGIENSLRLERTFTVLWRMDPKSERKQFYDKAAAHTSSLFSSSESSHMNGKNLGGMMTALPCWSNVTLSSGTAHRTYPALSFALAKNQLRMQRNLQQRVRLYLQAERGTRRCAVASVGHIVSNQTNSKMGCSLTKKPTGSPFWET
jgi:hypothetical protein